MSLLKQIDDKGAVLEWSPISHCPNLVALGTKDSSGVGFDDHGGELELHSLNFSDIRSKQSTLLGSVKSNSRFSSIAWSQMAKKADEYPYGLIAGGMADGNIHVWDPAKVVSGDADSLLASMEQHRGPICGLHFNPHKESSHLLASGGDDMEVWVTSLERPDAPSVFIPAPPPSQARHTASITKVAWNSQVPHILASAAQNGSCYVWDLKSKKAWCELKDPSGGCVSDVAWNPDQGLHIVTASGDDKNPVLKLWDLRSSTSLPLATLQGHSEGILSLSWCPTDSSLLLSCGKDNRTIMWDLFSLTAVYDLPSAAVVNYAEDADQAFGGLANAGQRRYDVKWSPCLPAVVSASSFDRKIQFFSMSGAKSRTGRAPKWLRKPVGATFGFGGKLVTFDNQNVPSSASAPGAKKPSGASPKVQISQVVEDPDLVAACDRFHEAMARKEYKQFCEMKAQSVDDGTTAQERQVWSLMNVICFGSNAREELLTHLGFDSAAITAAASDYIKNTESAQASGSSSEGGAGPSGPPSAEDVFGLDSMKATIPATSGHAPVIDLATSTPLMQTKAAELLAGALAGEAAEPTIRQAIIVGNFEAAVECCLQSGLLAEALLLAQCGDQLLRVKTQAAFFERQRRKHPFLNVLHAVIKNELSAYVATSDLSRWRETLALLSTYGKNDEFPVLCEALAHRLETEMRDNTSATLCFMCAANVSRTVGFWTAELVAANKEKGYSDTKALQNYIEKVVVFTHANPIDSLGPECAAFFARYGELLANQGRLDVSIKYLKGDNLAESILIDRLYNAGNKPAGSRPPPFPFTKTFIEVQLPTVQNAPVVATGKANQQVAAAQAQPVGQQSYSNAGPGSLTKQTSGGHLSQQNRSATINPDPSTRVQQQQHSNAAAVTAAAQNNGLPPGWLQLKDPGSGHFYYANQATGQTQWEPPVAVVPVVAAPVPVSIMTPQVTNAQQQRAAAMSSGPAVNPAAQQQYAPQSTQPSVFSPQHAAQAQQVQQPQVFNPAAAHQPAAFNPASVAPTSAAAPVAAAVAPVPVVVAHVPTTQELECAAMLSGIIEAVASVCVSPAEKKQIVMARTAQANLMERIQAGEMSADVLQKLVSLLECFSVRNFAGATVIQTDLANTAWTLHKEWIKGVKILIQLASKK